MKYLESYVQALTAIPNPHVQMVVAIYIAFGFAIVIMVPTVAILCLWSWAKWRYWPHLRRYTGGTGMK